MREALLIGAAPGDGTGDPARTGGQKVNDNFAELYAFLGGDSLPTPLTTLAFSGDIADATGTLAVGQGGTGSTTLTAGSVLLGNGTNPVTSFASTAGRLVIGNGSSGLTDDANLTWDATTTALTANGARMMRVGSTTNFFLGVTAGNTTLSGSDNNGIGTNALKALTSGSGNMAFGSDAAKRITTASDNVAIGSASLALCTSGPSNLAIGTNALFNLETANACTAVGVNAGFNSTGSNNTYIGSGAAFNLDSGSSENTCIGARAGTGTAGNFVYQNTFIGRDAGRFFTSAVDTVAIGFNSAITLRSGAQNTVIGSSADVSSGTGTNRTAVGYSASCDTDNCVVLGNGSVTIWKAGADATADLGTTGVRFKDGHFSGTLQFGTFTTLGAEVLTGYITITDAGGTTRKLGVIA